LRFPIFPLARVCNPCVEKYHKDGINLHPVIAKVFSLGEIAKAHGMAESDEANGKIVVRVD
jgi:NADPH:quinone reductase-like Zn-dependent oxidoreductase